MSLQYLFVYCRWFGEEADRARGHSRNLQGADRTHKKTPEMYI